MRSLKHYAFTAIAFLTFTAHAWAADSSVRESSLQIEVYYYGDDVLEIDVDRRRGDTGGEIRVYRDRLSAAGGEIFVKVDLPKKTGHYILTPAIPWEDALGYSVEVWRRDSLGAYRDDNFSAIWVPYQPQPIEPGQPFGPDTARPPVDQLEAANDPAHDLGDGYEGGLASLQVPDELHHAGEFDFGDGSSSDANDDGRDQLDQAGDANDFGDGSTGTATDDGRDRPDLDQPDGSQDTGDGSTNGSGTEPDCNGNGIPDRMEIMAYQPLDLNNNNELDECENLGDVNGDGRVDVRDLIRVMQAFGSCDGCIEDLNGTGTTDVSDLIIVLMRWQG